MSVYPIPAEKAYRILIDYQISWEENPPSGYGPDSGYGVEKGEWKISFMWPSKTGFYIPSGVFSTYEEARAARASAQREFSASYWKKKFVIDFVPIAKLQAIFRHTLLTTPNYLTMFFSCIFMEPESSAHLVKK
jgi:hypothetical protein